VRVEVEIKGIYPLLMHRFTEEAEVSVQQKSSRVNKGENGTPRSQADKFAYKHKSGKKRGMLYIPGNCMLAALIGAGKFHKLGRCKCTTQKSTLITAGMMVETETIELNTDHFEVDSRPVVNPVTGGRIMCHRPRLDKWGGTFQLWIDETMFTENLARAIVDDAGQKMGLLAFRPEKRGPYGRFVVTRWKVLDEDEVAN